MIAFKVWVKWFKDMNRSRMFSTLLECQRQIIQSLCTLLCLQLFIKWTRLNIKQNLGWYSCLRYQSLDLIVIFSIQSDRPVTENSNLNSWFSFVPGFSWVGFQFWSVIWLLPVSWMKISVLLGGTPLHTSSAYPSSQNSVYGLVILRPPHHHHHR